MQNSFGPVRSIDLAQSMGYSRPSISVALKKLENNNFVTKDDEGYLHLTEKGMHVAENMSERHEILTDILVKLGVDFNVAESDACKIEHVLSEDSYQKLKQCTMLYESR